MGLLDIQWCDGLIQTGYYHTSDGSTVTDHGWIELDDGNICDPTRWTLDDTEPDIYVGPMTGEYDLNGARWERELEALRDRFVRPHIDLTQAIREAL